MKGNENPVHVLPKSEYIQLLPADRLFSVNIMPHIEVFSYRAGEWLIEEGMSSDYLFYIHAGKAKIYVTHQNGKTSLLNFIEEDDILGDMELLHEGYYSKAVQAITDMIVFAIPFSTCREPLLEDAKFLKQLAIFLSNKATKMSAKYTYRFAFPLENRLAEFILETANNNIYKEKHVLVADYLGVSYRHLLFTLAQFCDDGLLEKSGRQYVITNKSKLQQLANTMQ